MSQSCMDPLDPFIPYPHTRSHSRSHDSGRPPVVSAAVAARPAEAELHAGGADGLDSLSSGGGALKAASQRASAASLAHLAERRGGLRTMVAALATLACAIAAPTAAAAAASVAASASAAASAAIAAAAAPASPTADRYNQPLYTPGPALNLRRRFRARAATAPALFAADEASSSVPPPPPSSPSSSSGAVLVVAPPHSTNSTGTAASSTGADASSTGVELRSSGAGSTGSVQPMPPALPPVPGPPSPAGPGKSETLGVDGGTAGETRERLLEIAERFKPVMWLHHEETYLPISVASYLSRVRLAYDPSWTEDGVSDPSSYVWIQDGLSDEDVTPDGLYRLLDAYRRRTDDPRLQELTRDNMALAGFQMSVMEKEHKKGVGSFSAVNTVPFYSRVRKYADHWEILYVSMYAYNGPYRLCGIECEPHSADVEHITVRTNKDATELEWCYFGAHGHADGMWHQAHEMQILPGDLANPTRPVAYSARSSHAVYGAPGYWRRLLGFGNDYTVGAAEGVDPATAPNRWDPPAPPVLMFDPRDPRYHASLQLPLSQQGGGGMRILEYQGGLAEVGIVSFANQAWFHAENEYQNNVFRRGFWVCRYCECNDGACYNACQRKVDFSSGKTAQHLHAIDNSGLASSSTGAGLGPPTMQAHMQR